MIHVTDNTCPICLKEGLKWHLNIRYSDVQMFKCGHGTCKECYKEMQNKIKDFSCPCCREKEQEFRNRFSSDETDKWTTFAEWYNEFEIYIRGGAANNIVKNTAFGKQLLRLHKEQRKFIKKSLSS